MTLSIDVLPAPFGPMIARISPLAISNRYVADRLDAAKRQRDPLHRPEKNLAGPGAAHAARSRRGRRAPDVSVISTMRALPFSTPLRPSS